MAQTESYQDLVLGGGAGGKLLAWHLAHAGRRVVVVERRWVGGSCPNIACLPSKNEIWSAKVADLLHHATQTGRLQTVVDAIWPLAQASAAYTREWSGASHRAK
jgi:pyruvate/2-oxoglutarate dehydrogenase complex dihydrolipoamide dehydrogenase (E3) component